jgi:hypothetical protein
MSKTERQELGRLVGSSKSEKWPALQSTAFILLASVVIWLAFVMAVANLS